MRTVTINLPEDIKDFADTQIASGRFGDVSQYVQDLIKKDQRSRAMEHVHDLLKDGDASGESSPLDKAEWDSIRKEARKKSRIEFDNT